MRRKPLLAVLASYLGMARTLAEAARALTDVRMFEPPEIEPPPLLKKKSVGPGAYLGDDYQVLDRIADGVTSTIYLAVDLRLDRHVAIKLFKAPAEDLSHFLREARAIARTHHPNVLEIYAAGEAFGAPYFVTEYVAGFSLATLFERNPQLPLQVACKIFSDVCSGLSAIHRAGLVYRGLHPRSVLVDYDYRAVLSDFSGAVERVAHSPSHRVEGDGVYLASGARREVRPDLMALSSLASRLFFGRNGEISRDLRAIQECLAEFGSACAKDGMDNIEHLRKEVLVLASCGKTGRFFET